MTMHNWSRRKVAAIVLICAISVSTSIIFWQMNQSAQAAVLDPHPGLAGWWRLDEDSGSLAEDSSGFDNHGTSFGTTPVIGKFGNALQFFGSSSYVQVPDDNSLSPESEVTVEAWIYPTSNTGQNYKRIVCKSASDDTGEYTLWLYNSGSVIWYVNDWTHGYIISSPIPLNEWTHVVGVFNGTLAGNRLKIYINGVLDNQGDTTDTEIVNTTRDLFIGDRGAADRGLIGYIDEVQIYDYTLSSTEIQAKFQATPGFSSKALAKIPQGTTEIIITLSWQGTGSITATLVSPHQSYQENTLPVYQKTTYSTTDGLASMLNIKRLSVSVSALSSDEEWHVELAFEQVDDYKLSIEIQK